MSDVEDSQTEAREPTTDKEPDQDSEATMNAPEEGRPDGLVALDEDDSDSTSGEGSPS